MNQNQIAAEIEL